MRTGTIVAAALLCVLVGCKTGGFGNGRIVPDPAVAAVAAEQAGMSVGDIARAADMYVLKCAKCHQFYDPADYGDASWSKWMTKMSRKTKLTPEEDDLLERYLEAYRKRPPNPSVEQPGTTQ